MSNEEWGVVAECRAPSCEVTVHNLHAGRSHQMRVVAVNTVGVWGLYIKCDVLLQCSYNVTFASTTLLLIVLSLPLLLLSSKGLILHLFMLPCSLSSLLPHEQSHKFIAKCSLRIYRSVDRKRPAPRPRCYYMQQCDGALDRIDLECSRMSRRTHQGVPAKLRH